MKVIGDSRLTVKCQTTIPRRVRELLGIGPGDLLVFVVRNGQIVIKRGELKVRG